VSDAISERETQLVNVGREIRRYWRNRTQGRIGPNDIVFLERSLDLALANYGDLMPVHDEDRREWANELLDRH
jgi:hypothetical protein